MRISVKTLHVCLGCVLSLALVTPSFADDDDVKTPAAEPKIETRTFLFEMDGEGLSSDSLDDLPEATRERIKVIMKKALSKAENETLQLRAEAAGGPKDNVKISSKATITIVGPNGETTTQEITPGSVIDGPVVIEMMQGAFGKELHINELMERITKSLQNAPVAEDKTENSTDLSEVLEKLDAILTRLNRLEADVEKLKSEE